MASRYLTKPLVVSRIAEILSTAPPEQRAQQLRDFQNEHPLVGRVLRDLIGPTPKRQNYVWLVRK